MVSKAFVVNPNKLTASVCRDSFFSFVKTFWHVLIAEEPIWNWHIEFICNEMQKMAERVFIGEPKKYDLLINVPPGSTKSTICSVMFPAWTFTRMPHARSICASNSDLLSLEFSNKCRTLVKSKLYQECFPEVEISDSQDTKTLWSTTRGGMRLACTVGGKSPIGFHGHFIIVDDPISPEKAVSEVELASANHWMKNVAGQRKVDQSISVVVLIMQRLAQDDPAGQWIDNNAEGMIRHVCLPARLADNVRPKYLRKRYVGGLLDPIRLPERVLFLKQYGPDALTKLGFSGQYQQKPTPEGGGDFLIDNIHLEDIVPDQGNPALWKRVWRYWDKAGTRNDGDFTVGAKIGLDKELNVWILHIVRGQWGPYQREEIIKQTAIEDGKWVWIGVEEEPGTAGAESVTATIKRLNEIGHSRVKKDKVTGDKRARAEPLAQAIGNGIVYMPSKRRASWVQPLLDELEHYPVSRFDDQVDALSGGYGMLTKHVCVGRAF
jgi:predicted phage terminase large subunit-like protein